jgi:helix-turn-helix protein
MKDTFCRRFFLEPTQTLHRRYEALRAVFVDQQPQMEVAKRLGYTYATLRRWVSDFRAQCRAGQAPPFSCPRSTGDLPGHIMARHPLAQTGPSGRMCGGCRGLQDAAYGPASLAFSSFSRCWPTSGSINS